MSLINLFEISEENKHDIKKEFDICDNIEKDKFSQYILENWLVSINLKINIMLDFLNTKKHYNIYEYIQRLYDNKEINNKEEELKNRLGGYYLKRETFTNSFENGTEFRYGALNINNAGAYYGCFAMFIKREKLNDIKITFVKEDSLRYFYKDKFLLDKFKKEIATKDNINLLTAIKFCDNRLDSTLICDLTEYIEAIMLSKITISDIEKVYLNNSIINDLLNEDSDNFIVKNRSYNYEDILNILDTIETNGIEVQIVE